MYIDPYIDLWYNLSVRWRRCVKYRRTDPNEPNFGPVDFAQKGGGSMAYTEAQKRATAKYMKENLEDIKFRVKKGEKEKYKNAAAEAGLSMAQFFVKAADEKIERDGLKAE